MLRRMLYSQLLGTVLYGIDEIRVGQVRRVLVDEITGRPEWVAVSTGALGARQRLVPVAAADLQPAGIRVPYPALVVLASPRFDPRDAAPNQAAEEELYRHYGMDGMDGDHGAAAPVTTVSALAGWDLTKVRRLLDQAFSYSQQPPEPAGEIPAVDSAGPGIESGDHQGPGVAGGGRVDGGGRP